MVMFPQANFSVAQGLITTDSSLALLLSGVEPDKFSYENMTNAFHPNLLINLDLKIMFTFKCNPSRYFPFHDSESILI